MNGFVLRATSCLSLSDEWFCLSLRNYLMCVKLWKGVGSMLYMGRADLVLDQVIVGENKKEVRDDKLYDFPDVRWLLQYLDNGFHSLVTVSN